MGRPDAEYFACTVVGLLGRLELEVDVVAGVGRVDVTPDLEVRIAALADDASFEDAGRNHPQDAALVLEQRGLAGRGSLSYARLERLQHATLVWIAGQRLEF